MDQPTIDNITIGEKSSVMALSGTQDFSGETSDFIDLGNPEALNLRNGTIALAFVAGNLEGTRTLFSKDGRNFDDGGHLTVKIVDGILQIRQQSDSASEILKANDHPITANMQYHVAASFGDDGLKLYLNGELVLAEPEFKQGIDMNERSLLLGASGTHRSDDSQTPRDPFDGTMGDFAVFDMQLGPIDVAALAGQTRSDFETSALAGMAVEELMPAFQQLHHASDTLKALASKYGFTHNGELQSGAAIIQGSDGDDKLNGKPGDNVHSGGLGDDVVGGGAGDDILQGGYGNDTVRGGSGRDILDGGHGEDLLQGGAGNDLLISQADGREGYVTYDPERDEGIDAGSADQLTGKVYTDQPIAADDILTGGGGADTFYFQTLINAKQRFIEEHTNDDGTIRWHGVAGENNNIHDHWVDVIGNDIITDFDKSEGDQIIIEGHTTEIFAVTHGDENGDGIIDHSLIELYSDQGRGGGAHNDDLLGTITVYGDRVTEADIIHSAAPAYGIVKGIDRLDEAVTPLAEAVDIEQTPNVKLDGFEGLEGLQPVFGVPGELAFDGSRDGAFVARHDDSLALSEGTIAFSFEADAITKRDALFSKDASGYVNGGHLTAFVEEDGDLKVRFQNETTATWLEAKGAVSRGVEHDFAFSFGAEGARLYLDGTEVDSDATFDENWLDNEEVLVIGANDWASPTGETGRLRDQFDGTITDFIILDEQLSANQVSSLAIFQDDTVA